MKKLNWSYTIFMWGIILGALYSAIHYLTTPVSSSIVLFAVVYGYLCGFTGSLGYHRYFAHRAYKVKPWLEWYFIIFGAAMWQGTITSWVTDHRRHHAFPDTEKDPYSVTRGYFWAHLGWLMYRVEPEPDKDLMAHPGIRWQHHNYYWIAALMGFVVPTLVGWYFGDALAGFLLGGVVRIFCTQHAVLLINSVGHAIGRRPYSKEENARDNLLLAVLALGEGNHNFHHTYPGDWRSGPRWYDVDPTKWMLMAWKKLGWATDFKEVYPPKEKHD